MNRKILKIAILVIEVMWIITLIIGCVALCDVMISRAATPYIDGRTGEYIIAEISTQDEAIEIQEALQISRISEALDEVDANGYQLEYLGEFKITYYCSCRKCNGKWGAIDGYGNHLEWGCVAVDPHTIPLHTKLVIDGYDTLFEARDTGSGVNGKHIDMYVPVSHQEALAMPQGQKLKVWKMQ